VDLKELEIRSILGIRMAWSLPGINLAAPTPSPVRDVSVRKREVRTQVVLFAGTCDPRRPDHWPPGFS
jgi:hypothetical protein